MKHITDYTLEDKRELSVEMYEALELCSDLLAKYYDDDRDGSPEAKAVCKAMEVLKKARGEV